MEIKQPFCLTSFLGGTSLGILVVGISTFIYLQIERQYMIETYHMLPLICFNYLVFPFLWISLSYLIVWLLYFFPHLQNTPVINLRIRRSLLIVCFTIIVVYYVISIGYMFGIFPNHPIIVSLLNHNFILFPVGLLLYYGIRKKGGESRAEVEI